MAKIGEYPDMVFAPCGGGSNFAGIAFPFLADKAAGKKVRLVGVEPTSCPSMTKGIYAYDYGDVSGYTPLMKMYTAACATTVNRRWCRSSLTRS